MGITGLIPFLEKSSKRTNVSEFRGGVAAIDSYCWLHKGAFSCAEKLLMGEQTDGHIKYCMKFIQMLLANRIKPILVFDGRHLPAKAETESKRRENRTSNRRKAAELMRSGRTNEGRSMLRRCVDITHEMALDLMKQCQENNIDCIVAPYEADAQLAYLNITGIADVVITEDSDLTLFGCKQILFKMDVNGNGLLVQQNRLHLAMGLREENFNMDQFLHMCILSGCDYLPSLPGIGLNKALKFILKNADADICRNLPRMASYLNMKTLVVPKEYIDQFVKAVVTFKHQLVYCPLQRKQVRLNPPGPDVTKEQLHYAGSEVEENLAFELALGNYDPFSFKKLHDFHPDRVIKKPNKKLSSHVSIWSKDYKPKEISRFSIASDKKKDKCTTVWPDTKGQVAILSTDKIKKEITPKKRTYQELQENLTDTELLTLYSAKDEKMRGGDTPPFYLNLSSTQNKEFSMVTERQTSPVLNRRVNPFLKTDSSPDLLAGNRRRRLRRIKFKPTVIDENVVVESQFFAKLNMKNDDEEIERENSKENGVSGKGEILRDRKIEIEEIPEKRNLRNKVFEKCGKLEENCEKMEEEEEIGENEETREKENLENRLLEKNGEFEKMEEEEIGENEEIRKEKNLENRIFQKNSDFQKIEEKPKEIGKTERILEERILKEMVLEKNDNWSHKNGKLEERMDEGMEDDYQGNTSSLEVELSRRYEQISNHRVEDSLADSAIDNSDSYSYASKENVSTESAAKEEHQETGDSDSEYFVSSERIEGSKSTFFQWENPKRSLRSSEKLSTSSLKNKSKLVPKQPRKNRKQVPEQGQQSLLQMFGFQKKSTLQS